MPLSVILVLLFSFGIFFAGIIRFNFIYIYSVAVLLLILSIFIRKNNLLLIAAIFFLGAVGFKNTQVLPKNHIWAYAYYRNNNLYHIKGFVASDPEFSIDKTSFIFRAQELYFNGRKANVCGDTLTFLKGRKNLAYGEALVMTATLQKPFKDYLSKRGIYVLARAKRIVRLNYNSGSRIKRLALQLKNGIEGIIVGYVPIPTAGIVSAMLLGEKKDVAPLVYDSMVKTGTVHVLVVSGFNVGIVFLVITLFLRLLRLPRRLRICLAIPLLIIYCLMTGASNPVVRATVMAAIFLSAYLFKKEPDVYNSLALAALFILISDPRQLFDIGFQLSFLSVLAIAYVYPKARSRFGIDKFKIKPVRLVLDGFFVSFSAWLGTAGLIACYFKTFSPVTVLANILIVPLATLINLCGCVLVLAGLFFPYLAHPVSLFCQLLAIWLININNLMLEIPGAYWRLP